MSIDIFTNGITFTLSSSEIDFQWRKMFLLVWRNIRNKLIQADMVTTQLIIIILLKKVHLRERASDMRLIFKGLFQREHQQIKKLMIPVCKNSTDIYHLNVLIIIAIIYHLYIERELYNLDYINKPGWVY